MYAYARRLGEVLLLTWGDIDLDRNTITFTILKKKSPEKATYELEDWIKDLLIKYRSYLGRDRLFEVTARAVEKGFKRDCELAGIPAKW
jgi:integrase